MFKKSKKCLTNYRNYDYFIALHVRLVHLVMVIFRVYNEKNQNLCTRLFRSVCVMFFTDRLTKITKCRRHVTQYSKLNFPIRMELGCTKMSSECSFLPVLFGPTCVSWLVAMVSKCKHIYNGCFWNEQKKRFLRLSMENYCLVQDYSKKKLYFKSFLISLQSLCVEFTNIRELCIKRA